MSCILSWSNPFDPLTCVFYLDRWPDLRPGDGCSPDCKVEALYESKTYTAYIHILGALTLLIELYPSRSSKHSMANIFSHFFAEVFLQQFLSAFGLPNSMWSHGPRLAALESLVFRTAYLASQTGNPLDVLRYHTKDGRKHPSEACDDGNNWDQDSENLNGNQCSNYQCY